MYFSEKKKTMQIIRDFYSKLEEISQSGYYVKIEYYLSRGFSIFKKKPEFFLLYTALYMVSMPLGGFLLTYPLTAGFFIAAHRIDSGKPVYFEHFFDGFKDFIQLTLLMIIQGIVVSIGFILLVIPGIYLSVCYYFAPFFVVFGKMDFWGAMESSRRMVNREWFPVFGLLIVLGIINFVGVLAFGVGVLFTLPVTFCASYAAFDDIIGLKD